MHFWDHKEESRKQNTKRTFIKHQRNERKTDKRSKTGTKK